MRSGQEGASPVGFCGMHLNGAKLDEGGGSGMHTRVHTRVYGGRGVVEVVFSTRKVEQGVENSRALLKGLSSRKRLGNDFRVRPLGRWRGCTWTRGYFRGACFGGERDKLVFGKISHGYAVGLVARSSRLEDVVGSEEQHKERALA